MTEGTLMNFRDELILDIENALDFRARKADEYPDDQRNAQAAEALAGLLEHLNQLPDNHRLFEAYRRAFQECRNDDGPVKIMNEVLGRIPGETDRFARYGFGEKPDHAEFVEALADDLIRSWSDHGFSMEGISSRTH